MPRTLTGAELEEIDRLFTYHAPTMEQVDRLTILRNRARAMAQEIFRCCPRSADRSAAIRLLRECVMTANASIVLETAGERDAPGPLGPHRTRMEPLDPFDPSLMATS